MRIAAAGSSWRRSLGKGPSSSRGCRMRIAGRARGAGVEPSSGGRTGPRRIWHQRASLARCRGCPGVYGPVPQPVSMDGRRLPAASRSVNRFIRMKRWIIVERDRATSHVPFTLRILRRMRIPRFRCLPVAWRPPARRLQHRPGPEATRSRRCADAPAPHRRRGRRRSVCVSAETPAEELDSLATWPSRGRP